MLIEIITQLIKYNIQQTRHTLNTKSKWLYQERHGKLFAESSFIGSYGVSDKDYNIVMHRGYPHTFINASQVVIKRDAQGYQIYGISNNRQDFRFFEPDASGINRLQKLQLQISH